MLKPSQDQDYYFDDPNSPDGPYEYHLQRRGENLELFRDDTSIRDALDDVRRANKRLFEQGVLRVLEYFLQNADAKIKRTAIEDAIGNLEPYLGRIRQLLNDPPPGRLIQKAQSGQLVFTQKVRHAPTSLGFTYAKDLNLHWKPRAMGCGALFQGGRWYFSGRTAVLQDLIGWLAQHSSAGVTRVVTGHPGSGKSAILGYVVTGSDRNEVKQGQLAEFLASMPEGTRPKPGSIDFAINLRDRTLSETLSALASSFRCKPEEAVSALANRQRNTALVFDSLDEATETALIAETILRPLTGYDHLWLMVGCRRPELPRLGASVAVVDLDEAAFRDDSDIAAYINRILLAKDELRHSPYRDNPAAARIAADAVARAANGNFLVAFITARSLLERTSVLEPDREQLPRTTEEAFSEYLRRLGDRSGLGYGRLRAALTPLAYGQGQGLPREVWSRLTHEDVDGLLDLAAAFIPEYEEDGHTVYRCYHRALTEALHDPRHAAEQHRTIAETLAEAVPNHDWLRADWYTRKYLALHAAEAGSLDELLLDTKFLAIAAPPQLVSVTHRAISPQARRRANWYQLSVDRLSDRSVADRLGQLEMIARQQGAEDLARSTEISGVARSWRTCWAQWALAIPHRVIRGAPVWAVALASEVIVSAGWHIQRRDLASGQAIGRPINGPEDGINSLRISQGVIVGGSPYSGQVWQWDLATGEPVGQPILAHPGFSIEALAASGNVIVSASNDGTVRVWDRLTGQPLTAPLTGHTHAVSGVAIQDNVVVSVADDGIRFWDLETGNQLRDLIEGEFTGLAVLGNTIVSLKNHILGPDRGIMRWDLQTGREIGELFGCSEYHLKIAGHDQLVVCGGYDGLITLWDVTTGDQIGSVLHGHEEQINGLAVDQDWVVSTSRDGTLRIWNWKMTQSIGQPLWTRDTYRMGGDSKPDGGVRALAIDD
jgi:WD40 repeat protein